MLRRAIDRDGLSEDAAEKRLAAQMTNKEYIRHANVVFSTQWEPAYTKQQVRIITATCNIISLYETIMFANTIVLFANTIVANAIVLCTH